MLYETTLTSIAFWECGKMNSSSAFIGIDVFFAGTMTFQQIEINQ